jgi:dolichol-phosphate mannosyltransferase
VDREIGSSKLKTGTIIDYARQVVDITLYSFSHHNSAAWREWKRVFKFGIVGISGIVINLGILFLLVEFFTMNKDLASPIAIEISILSNFILNDLWTFGSIEDQKVSGRWNRLVAFNFVSVGGAVINYVIFLMLTTWFAFYYLAAQLIGIMIAFVWNFLVNRRVTWKRTRG